MCSFVHGEPAGRSKVPGGGHSCSILSLRGYRGSVTLPALRGQSCGLFLVGWLSVEEVGSGRLSLRYRERMLHNKVRD